MVKLEEEEYLPSLRVQTPTEKGPSNIDRVEVGSESTLFEPSSPLTPIEKSYFAPASQESDGAYRPAKRRRTFECVEILPYRRGRTNEQTPHVKDEPVGLKLEYSQGYVKEERSLKEEDWTPAKLENPKFKKPKKEMGLAPDTVRERLKHCAGYEIPVDREIWDVAVSRPFMSEFWGGNTQETFPRIRKAMLEKHKMDDFAYLSLNYNPHAPQLPGTPGLFFESNGTEAEEREWRVFTRGSANNWLYQGQYTTHAAPDLTVAEWAAQSYTVRKTWSENILSKGWGTSVKARVGLRKVLGREPTQDQLEKALEDERKFPGLTPGDIERAYNEGEETMTVWVMQCVGYDVEFQREIARRFPGYVYVPKKVKDGKKVDKVKTKATPKGQRRAKAKARVLKVKPGKKRKRAASETDESSSEDSTGIEDLEDDPMSEDEVLQLMRKGTRSRPLVIS